MSCAQAHWVGSKAIRRVMQLKLHKSTMAIGYSLCMCARHVDSTNPGRRNLVFRSKPIPVTCRFLLFCSIVSYTASALKILLQNQNTLVITEVIGLLVWLLKTIKKSEKFNEKFKICRVIIILCNHHFILMKFTWAIKGFILYQI